MSAYNSVVFRAFTDTCSRCRITHTRGSDSGAPVPAPGRQQAAVYPQGWGPVGLASPLLGVLKSIHVCHVWYLDFIVS